MYKIYKTSELYKFVNCHFFDRNRYWPGGAGYNFCSYVKDITKAVLACVVGYGSLAYLAIFGIAPWYLWLIADYPSPMLFGPGLLSMATLIVGVVMMAGVLMSIIFGITASADKTGWNVKLVDYLDDKWEKTSIGEFFSTAYRAWKGKYCPLVEVI